MTDVDRLVQDYLAMRRAMAIAPTNEQLDALIARGMKVEGVCESDAPLFPPAE